MLKYYPHKSDKPGKAYYKITERPIEHVILGLVAIMILKYIKMNNRNTDILLDTK
jgi:hypothetical protein